MKKRVAINGFGRIGRLVFRHLFDHTDVDIVAINDLTDNATLAHLLEYDSTHRRYAQEISATETSLRVNGSEIAAFSERDPSKLPWSELKVDIVLECTGVFLTREKASLHLQAGAKRVLLSAPAKSSDIETVVLGVNDEILQHHQDILSNASCTTNCLGPMVKVLDEHFGIESGFMTTIHAYTAAQQILDAPHKDLRRARAAAENIIPTTTGAAKALALVYPSVKGKIEASSIRVPVPCGSLTELSVQLTKDFTEESVNALFKEASSDSLKGILEYTEAPIVSSDILGNAHSCILDASLTKKSGNMIKVVGWYDNEYGYSSRLADLVGKI